MEWQSQDAGKCQQQDKEQQAHPGQGGGSAKVSWTRLGPRATAERKKTSQLQRRHYGGLAPLYMHPLTHSLNGESQNISVHQVLSSERSRQLEQARRGVHCIPGQQTHKNSLNFKGCEQHLLRKTEETRTEHSRAGLMFSNNKSAPENLFQHRDICVGRALTM